VIAAPLPLSLAQSRLRFANRTVSEHCPQEIGYKTNTLVPSKKSEQYGLRQSNSKLPASTNGIHDSVKHHHGYEKPICSSISILTDSHMDLILTQRVSSWQTVVLPRGKDRDHVRKSATAPFRCGLVTRPTAPASGFWDIKRCYNQFNDPIADSYGVGTVGGLRGRSVCERLG